MPPKRQRTDYDDDGDDDSSPNSDPSTEYFTVVTIDAPTYTITETLSEATTDTGTAASPAEVMKSTKVRKPYLQKAGSKNAAKILAETREIAGKEESRLPPEFTDWPTTVFRKYQPKKGITIYDRCKLRFALCNQEPDGCLRCKRNGKTCTTADTIFHTICGGDVSQDVADADAQLPARLKAAAQERNLLRAEMARNPSLQEIRQLRLNNEQLRQEDERLERKLAALIPQGGRNRPAAYAASQVTAAADPPKRAANPRKPANNGNPTADDTESWPSAYVPAPSEYMGVLDTQSPDSPSMQTPVNRDNPQPANTNGRLSKCSALPLEYVGSPDVRSARTPSTRMAAQPNNGRTAPATNQATLLGNPYTQAPSPLTYENTGYELYGLATLPEFARPDTIMRSELPKHVAKGIPGQTRAREVFPPEWMKYLYRKPEEDRESNDDADFDERMWDE